MKRILLALCVALVFAVGAYAQQFQDLLARRLCIGSALSTCNTIRQGAGTPEASITGIVGDLYLRTNGGTSTTLYVKESGSGNTGWAAAGGGGGTFGNGSAGTPSIAFTSDTDTGFYRVTTNSIGAAVAGGNVLTLDTTALQSTLPFYGPDGLSGTPTYTFTNAPNKGFWYAGSSVVNLDGNLLVNGSSNTALQNRGSSGTAQTITWANGNVQRTTLTGNVTFTFASPTSGGIYILEVFTGAGGFTAAWPGTVKWNGGSTPTITATAARMDLVRFVYDGVSSEYFGEILQTFTP